MLRLARFGVFICLFGLLFFASYPSLSQAEPYISLSADSGTYKEDVILSIETIAGYDRVFYSFSDSEGNNGPWIPFDEGLPLTSSDGEEMEYRIGIWLFRSGALHGERNLRFVIDKKKPSPPLLAVPPGEYANDVSVSFRKRDGESVVYAINSIVVESGIVWDGNGIRLRGDTGGKTRYVIQAYSKDGAGNKSSVTTGRYVIDKKRKPDDVAVVEIKSPVAGTFGNKQLLYITSKNTGAIYYTTDGGDPATGGIPYTGPVILDAEGSVLLRVAAENRWRDAGTVSARVSYRVRPADVNPVLPDEAGGNLFGDAVVTLKGGGASRYRFTLSEKSPAGGDSLTDGRLTLAGKPGESVYLPLRVKPVYQDDSTGPEYRFFYCINRKKTAIKGIFVEGGGPESGPARVTIGGTGDSSIFYTLDGTIPDEEALPYDGPFVLPMRCMDEYGAVWITAAAFDGASGMGEVVRRHFVIIRRKPKPPEIRVLAQPRKRDYVKIGFDEKTIVFCEITSDGTKPGIPGSDSHKVGADLAFTVPFGMEKTVRCAFSSYDTITGGMSDPVYSEYFLDRKPPANPEIGSLAEGRYSRNPVVVFIREDVEEDADSSVSYAITDDGEEPVLKEDGGIRYTGPFELRSKDQTETTYRITARAVDRYGNVSYSVEDFYCKIDRKPPPPPPAPFITPSGEAMERRYSIRWEKAADEEILYRLYIEGEPPGDFILYRSPIPYDASQYPRGIMLESYYRDMAGNVGEPFIFRLKGDPKDFIDVLYVTGITDGSHYNRPVSFEIKAKEAGIIRYELTDDGSLPPGVGITSPVYAGKMSLDVPDGASRRYAVRARIMERDICDLSRGELLLSFAVDKEPPPPPEVEGIEEGGYYFDARELTFTSDNASVYYAVRTEYEDTAKRYPKTFARYSERVVLDVPEGRTEHFIVSAYTMDKAGNLSREVRQWGIHIDKNSIYVSSGGDDSHEGTRDRPLRTLRGALRYSDETGRRQLVFSCGSYSLDKPIEINSDIEIRGGLRAGDWERCGPVQATIIETGNHFQAEGSLLHITGGTVKLHGVTLRDEYGLCSSLVDLGGGRLSVSRSTLRFNRKAWGSCIGAGGGILTIDRCYFDGGETGNGAFIDGSGVELTIDDSEFIGPENGYDFVCLRLKACGGVLVNNSGFFPGEGGITRGIECSDSTVDFNNTRIDSGSGVRNAIGMSVRDSSIRIKDSIVNGNRASSYVIGITCANTALTLDHCTVNVNARSGAQGIRVRGGTVEVMRSTIKSGGTGEFLSLFDCDGERGSYCNNLVLSGASPDTVCVTIHDSESFWINNTIVVGRECEKPAGFVFRSQSSCRLLNNIIIHEGTPAGSAIRFVGIMPDAAVISCNNLSGWEHLLAIDHSGRLSQYSGDGGGAGIYKSDIEAFNASDGDNGGGSLHGNISEQFRDTFGGTPDALFHLSASSRCIDAGLDVGSFGGEGVKRDIDGETRPSAGNGSRRLYDIGSDEVHRK
ncbi:MAG: chitobiase/beta-hexosaminidase C-terminal domain-containing protein [Spirochaetales bacterium]|nr:chitobiase/beta-hexosaminidase C-terminal domain-containing protein [Spirochaetales bacterium]